MNSFIKQIQLGTSTYDVNVVDGAINTNQLAANAVVEGKIADGSVTTSKIEGLAVTKDKISEALAEEIEGKQDIISDLSTIRSNAAAGKTASDNLDGHTVAANVPANAKFTDTIYDDTALKGRVTTIEGKIPTAATSSNQLADKAFVNSSISTNTAEFKGTVENLNDFLDLDGNKNDYAFYKHTTPEGNVVFDRYKWVEGTSQSFPEGDWIFNDVVIDTKNWNDPNILFETTSETGESIYGNRMYFDTDDNQLGYEGNEEEFTAYDETNGWYANSYKTINIQNQPSSDCINFIIANATKQQVGNWHYEYTLNNSSFTAAQWGAINSGITSADKSKLDGISSGAVSASVSGTTLILS